MTGTELKAVIGWNVRTRREANRISQDALGELVGCSAALISRIESGKGAPSVEMIAALAGALNTEAADLLSEPAAGVTGKADVGTFSEMEDVLTVTEAASALGLSTEMVRRHCSEGHITAKRSSSGWLIDRSELDRFRQQKRSRGRPKKNVGAA